MMVLGRMALWGILCRVALTKDRELLVDVGELCAVFVGEFLVDVVTVRARVLNGSSKPLLGPSLLDEQSLDFLPTPLERCDLEVDRGGMSPHEAQLLGLRPYDLLASLQFRPLGVRGRRVLDARIDGSKLTEEFVDTVGHDVSPVPGW